MFTLNKACVLAPEAWLKHGTLPGRRLPDFFYVLPMFFCFKVV
jgi:hypothetical protein